MAQPQAAPMNGGDGNFSYAKNSHLQREGFIAAKKIIQELLTQSLDVESMLSGSTRFTIADLGCSVGPNTFFAMQAILEAVEENCRDRKKLEFQVLFNDQTSNDFNTLFASLPPDRKYFVAGVPGSFYDQLFPSSSIHVAFSSSSLHWLSKVPKELQVKNSPAWNKGRIHYTGAPEAVVRAYANQYEEDMEIFLRARAQEIVRGGMIVMILPGVHDGELTHDVGLAFTFLGSIMMDMVKEGVLSEDQVDSFNIPHVYPSVKQMKKVVEKNGSFSIVKMETRNARTDVTAPINIDSAIMHLRALAEATVTNHFGSEIVDEIFARAMVRKSDFSHMLYSSGIEIGVQLFAALKRK